MLQLEFSKALYQDATNDTMLWIDDGDLDDPVNLVIQRGVEKWGIKLVHEEQTEGIIDASPFDELVVIECHRTASLDRQRLIQLPERVLVLEFDESQDHVCLWATNHKLVAEVYPEEIEAFVARQEEQSCVKSRDRLRRFRKSIGAAC